MTRFLVVYQGHVSGSPGGREDGYPEEKHVVCDSLAEASRYADRKGFELYECRRLPAEVAVSARLEQELEEEELWRQAEEVREREELAHLQTKYRDEA